MKIKTVLPLCLLLAASLLHAADNKTVELKNAKGESVGTATLEETKGNGVTLNLDLKNLPPGDHAITYIKRRNATGPISSRPAGISIQMQEARVRESRGPSRWRHAELHWRVQMEPPRPR
jgi:hypothetical protein